MPTEIKQPDKDVQRVQDSRSGQVKSGTSAPTQASKSPGKDQAFSSTKARKLSPEVERAIRLSSEHSERIKNQVLSHLDWDLKVKTPKPAFTSFYFFCSNELYSKNAELQHFDTKLKPVSASRLRKGGVVETGQAWECKDEMLAQGLEMTVERMQPRMYLGYDMVTVGGTLRSCRVLCQS